MQRSSRRRRGRTQQLADVSMTPLIDTALTLLIIFMVTTPMMHNAIKVNLPQGKSQEAATSQQDLVVYLDKEGVIYLNGTKVINKSLITELKKQIGEHQDKTVFVKADRAVSYGTVIEMVDHIKVVGGVQYVALATQKHA